MFSLVISHKKTSEKYFSFNDDDIKEKHSFYFLSRFKETHTHTHTYMLTLTFLCRREAKYMKKQQEEALNCKNKFSTFAPLKNTYITHIRTRTINVLKHTHTFSPHTPKSHT